LELTFEVAGTKEIKTWIMGFGAPAKVLETGGIGQRNQRGFGEID